MEFTFSDTQKNRKNKEKPTLIDLFPKQYEIKLTF
jgi:hypothetical protein